MLRVIMIDPGLEQSMLEGMRPAEHGTQILLDPDRLDAVLRSVRSAVGRRGRRQPAGRAGLRPGAPPGHPPPRRPQPGLLPVLSYREVTSANVGIETVGWCAMPNRFRLKGASLEEIRSKAEPQHGPAARIVSAERVISPGIAGLFAATATRPSSRSCPGTTSSPARSCRIPTSCPR